MEEGLERFKTELVSEMHAQALDELRTGRKTSHWIWYVFPQLRGLGNSPAAVRYGLDGRDEAVAYLEDDDLRLRLISALEAVHDQVCARGVKIGDLMGSEIDALKLLSSITLFSALCEDHEGEDRPKLSLLTADLLAAAGREGRPSCRWTLAQLA